MWLSRLSASPAGDARTMAARRTLDKYETVADRLRKGYEALTNVGQDGTLYNVERGQRCTTVVPKVYETKRKRTKAPATRDRG